MSESSNDIVMAEMALKTCTRDFSAGTCVVLNAKPSVFQRSGTHVLTWYQTAEDFIHAKDRMIFLILKKIIPVSNTGEYGDLYMTTMGILDIYDTDNLLVL